MPSLDAGAARLNLFVERAHSVAPRVPAGSMRRSWRSAVGLDGIPLAIELAASRMASMTATEVRDRLDRPVSGYWSAHGEAWSATRRCAMRWQWSYDLLDDAEKALLNRCSVFAGGFDTRKRLCSSRYPTIRRFSALDLLDALVRKSLLVADRSCRPDARFSMLETIRQFAEDQLVASGAAEESRTVPMPATSPAARPMSLALWDSPRQREAYTWFFTELANLRTAFRWAADHDDLDVAATIAAYAAFVGFCVENYEPVVWAEELIEPAQSLDHPRLLFLYTMASQCWLVGRVDEAVRYSDAGQKAMGSGRKEIPFGLQGVLANPYLAIGQPDRCVDWCRAQVEIAEHVSLTAYLVMVLTIAGREEEAIATAEGLTEAGEAADNPYVHSTALMADGFAWRNADPDRALVAMQRGVAIALDSGNRFNETHLTANLAELAVERGDPRLHSITSVGRFGTCRIRATPSPSVRLSRTLQSCSTESDATSLRRPSPVSPFSPLTAAWLLTNQHSISASTRGARSR